MNVPKLTSLSQRFNGAIFYLVAFSSSVLCISGWNVAWLSLLFAYGMLIAFQAHTNGLRDIIKFGIIFVGFATTTGLLAGLLSVRLVGDPNSRYLLLALLLIPLSIFRNNRGLELNDKDSLARYVSLSIVATVSITLILLSTSKNVFAWLLNTWDGATQPGIVTVIWGQGHIDYTGDIPTGYEGYPRAIHFVEAWLTSTINTFEYSPKLTVSFFALANIVVYTLLIYALYHFTQALFRVSSWTVSTFHHLFSLCLLAAIMMSPFFVQGLFLHHSINFWVSLICILVGSTIVLDLANMEGSSSKKIPSRIDQLVMTSSLVIVSHSYQMLLPLMFFIALFFLVLRKKIFTNSRISFRIHYVTVLNVLSLLIASVALFNWFSYPSSEGDRFTFTGALNTIPFEIVVICLLVSLIWVWYCDRNSSWTELDRYFLPLFLAGIIFCWLALWLISGSFDRSPGLNYYPKKFEYALVILLLPFLVTGASMLLSMFPKRGLSNSSLKVYTFALSFAMFFWGLVNLTKPILYLNLSFSSISEAAIKEARVEGPSTIVGETGHISLAGSFLSNTLDLSFWMNPHPDIALYHYGGNIIANSGIVKERKPCEITDLLGGPSRVYDLSRNGNYNCWQ